MLTDTTPPWTFDLEQAHRVQDNLRTQLVLSWNGRTVATVGGIDFSSSGNTLHAAILIYSYPELQHIQTITGKAPQDFPYIAGLLIYQVGPAILDAWKRLSSKPDLLFLHGHGIAHPRGIGLASHVGLWLNIPTIGVAKTLLYGHQSEPGGQVGAWCNLTDVHNCRKVIGAVLRTALDSRPVYVSAGHLIDLQHTIQFVLETCRGYRMPEPIRAAHQAAAAAENKLSMH
jgi:deoxyribonuclease V